MEQACKSALPTTFTPPLMHQHHSGLKPLSSVQVKFACRKLHYGETVHAPSAPEEILLHEVYYDVDFNVMVRWKL